MILVWDGRIADWVAKRIPGCERGFSNCTCLGVISQDKIIAGLVFHNWSPESGVIEISCAATDPRWMTRTTMNVAFWYVFEAVKCQMAVARIDETNAPARKLWLGLGASEYVIPRLRGPQTAEAIYTLTDDQWSRSRFKR